MSAELAPEAVPAHEAPIVAAAEDL
ncbi:MAG: hypothetical protein JWP74_1262, partial [Marmoricola sp.]|nr:hypothetical protein [Marmoricola sp.]